jgi:hypothetical protein
MNQLSPATNHTSYSAFDGLPGESPLPTEERLHGYEITVDYDFRNAQGAFGPMSLEEAKLKAPRFWDREDTIQVVVWHLDGLGAGEAIWVNGEALSGKEWPLVGVGEAAPVIAPVRSRPSGLAERYELALR